MDKKNFLTIALVVLLIISSGISVYLYTQNQDLNKKLSGNEIGGNRVMYINTLNRIMNDNKNNTFAPPISMYQALLVGFGYNNYTEDTLMELKATRVDVKLVYGYIDQASNETVIDGVLATPQIDYSNFVVNGVTYRYMWQIVAYNASADLMPVSHDGYCLVDAVTGEFLPVPAS